MMSEKTLVVLLLIFSYLLVAEGETADEDCEFSFLAISYVLYPFFLLLNVFFSIRFLY